MIELNGAVINFEKFPNGETKVYTEQIKQNSMLRNMIRLKYEDDSDLIKLMFLKKHLDQKKYISHLEIAYMPYSRMDRSENGSVFTLKYVTQFINSLGFYGVKVIEPHSDVTLALIDGSYPVYPTIERIDEVAKAVGFDKDHDFLFFPDAGAVKRYSKIEGYKYLTGVKVRNFETGRIESLGVMGVGDIEYEGFKVIILDDICSYGGTFDLSAKALRANGASEVYLFVSHCEDSIHNGNLLKEDQIDLIITTDSIITIPHRKINVLSKGE